ncbi:hypothetical protein Tco_1085410 [Tanacetum coccineum]
MEIRNHFIRDSYEKKLIQVIKIHTDHNVVDLLTKSFDVSRFNFLVASIDKKELAIPGQTTTGKEFSNPLMASSFPKTISAQFWNTATYKTINSVKQIHAIVDGKAVVISESSVRNDLLFDDEDGITCITNDEIFENLALIRSKKVLEKPDEPPLPEGHTSRSGKGRMEHTFELMETVPRTPHDSPLTGGYTTRSDEGRLKLKELMAMCIKWSQQVLDFEKEKDAQAVEILKLKQRVKKLERNRKSSISHPRRKIYRQVESFDDDLDEEDASKQGRKSDKIKPMFKDSGFDDLDDLVDEGMDFVQEKDTKVVKGCGDTEMKEEKAKEKGVVIKDVKDSSRPIRLITTLQPLPTIDPKDKGKGILQGTKPVEKTKKKVQGDAQIERDAKIALRIQAKLGEELRVERERQEETFKVAIADMFDEVQAMIDVDYELAARMTQEEQEKYTIKERARLLAELFERRKK